MIIDYYKVKIGIKCQLTLTSLAGLLELVHTKIMMIVVPGMISKRQNSESLSAVILNQETARVWKVMKDRPITY